jgi:hypothetical protein
MYLIFNIESLHSKRRGQIWLRRVEDKFGLTYHLITMIGYFQGWLGICTAFQLWAYFVNSCYKIKERWIEGGWGTKDMDVDTFCWQYQSTLSFLNVIILIIIYIY